MHNDLRNDGPQSAVDISCIRAVKNKLAADLNVTKNKGIDLDLDAVIVNDGA